ncbi:hypothetical protein [Flavobacterium humi]|uniref:TonB-dependent receptor plug domain-containing protein n=1 Tax=Flavobacterium humi TaxID=2562683 RepID=A0A4Z0L774_9FLAO|nr:hypothetical protein [Flavobacterium humi]TGD56963.1 hypothetical protein E4635_14315 [Flavobacterium humi]
MDRLTHRVITVFVLLYSFAIAAQGTVSSNSNLSNTTGESLFVHINTSTFLTGETLYYKLYCLNPKDNTPSLISKIGYIELIDANKQIVFKNKAYLDKGKGYGDFFIPTTLKTGNYKLIAYTKWMLNKGESPYYILDITIINPFTADESGTKESGASTAVAKKDSLKTGAPAMAHTTSEKPLVLELDKKTYANREKVQLTLKSSSPEWKTGNYSVSIRKTDDLPILKQKNSEEFAREKPLASIANPSNAAFLPELRGEFISGKIISAKGQDVSNKPVSLSIPGKPFIFKLIKTNARGEFAFILDKNPENSSAVIQVVDPSKENFSIVLDDPATVDASRLEFLPGFELPAIHKKAIEERSIAAQVENAYYSKKKDTIAHLSDPDIFMGSDAKEYVLDDYTRFPTLKETVTEVLIECHSRRKNNKLMIYLSNDKINLDNYGPPLVLVDGLLLQDTNEIFEYNVANIHKVSLINQPYIYGPKTFGGVISFETKTVDFQSKSEGSYNKKTTLLIPSYGKKYYAPDYQPGHDLKRIPDYRYQLLWNPEMTVKNNEEVLTFFTSDVTGEFEITIEGFTDSGMPVSLQEKFEVK